MHLIRNFSWQQSLFWNHLCMKPLIVNCSETGITPEKIIQRLPICAHFLTDRRIANNGWNFLLFRIIFLSQRILSISSGDICATLSISKSWNAKHKSSRLSRMVSYDNPAAKTERLKNSKSLLSSWTGRPILLREILPNLLYSIPKDNYSFKHPYFNVA